MRSAKNTSTHIIRSDLDDYIWQIGGGKEFRWLQKLVRTFSNILLKQPFESFLKRACVCACTLYFQISNGHELEQTFREWFCYNNFYFEQAFLWRLPFKQLYHNICITLHVRNSPTTSPSQFHPLLDRINHSSASQHPLEPIFSSGIYTYGLYKSSTIIHTNSSFSCIYPGSLHLFHIFLSILRCPYGFLISSLTVFIIFRYFVGRVSSTLSPHLRCNYRVIPPILSGETPSYLQ